MRIHARAESLSLETDERGWELHASTDEGDSIVLNIHGLAFEFAGSDGLRSLLEWRAEGESVRQTFEANPGGLELRVLHDFAADDPKSEGYGERMREGADLARKAERENR